MDESQARRINRIMGDLVSSINNDISPIIQPTNPEGGYFGVPRAVLCYVDFLGLLFEGWSGKKKKNGNIDDFATSDKAKKYIKDVLSQVDSLYRDNSDLLYEMYRHGTVHIYSPKKMISKDYPDRSIEWLIYKGDREQWDFYEGRSVKFRHLQVIKWGENRFMLPVSIVMLYKDLLISIEVYRKMIFTDTTGELPKKLLSVADALDTVFDTTPHKFWKNATDLT